MRVAWFSLRTSVNGVSWLRVISWWCFLAIGFIICSWFTYFIGRSWFVETRGPAFSFRFRVTLCGILVKWWFMMITSGGSRVAVSTVITMSFMQFTFISSLSLSTHLSHTLSPPISPSSPHTPSSSPPTSSLPISLCPPPALPPHSQPSSLISPFHLKFL